MFQQTSLFPLPDYEPDFTPDCWETPDHIAQRMASLVLPSDRRIMEPAAGTGQIAQYLPPGSFCCEIKPNRVQRLRLKAPHCQPIQADFLSLERGMPPLSEFEGLHQGFDVIVTNPPFSLAIEFIEQGLRLLNTGNPSARLLYLLPIDFCSSVERGKAFQALECHIHHEYRILNRVAYMRDGKPQKGRQIYDAVFDIRQCILAGAVSFLN
jgi:hypothetical protein